MSRTLCFLSMMACLAITPAARADSFAAQPGNVLRFAVQQYPAVRYGFFQQRINEPGTKSQIFISGRNEGDGPGRAPANLPAHVSIPELATLALLGTGFVCLSLGLRSLRAKSKFGN